jgi:nitrate/nitrite transport system ATP-binding protein
VFLHARAAERRDIVEYYLARVGLSDAMDRRASELSNGMRQRVGLARAFALSPKLLLLDEPFGMLDALTRWDLQEVLMDILKRTKITAICVTHDVDEAILLADRIIPLSVGPAATLGPAVTVTVPRPRDRKAMNHHAGFKAVRNQVIEYLLGPGKRRPQPGPSAPSTTTSPVAKGTPSASAPAAVSGVSSVSSITAPEATTLPASPPREVAA